MTNEEKNPNKRTIPNLRFAEFSEEWEENKLGNVSELINKKVSTSFLSLDNYISTENLLQNFEGITRASSLPLNINVTSYKKRDILLSNIRPYLKKIWKATLNGGCNSDVLVFRSNESCLSDFLYYSLANEDFITYVMASAKGVKMPRGDKQQMQHYSIYLPSICEQQKIADFLTLIDERIGKSRKIIEGLTSFKSAVSKKIFSQELRFKDENGKDFPKWGKYTLGDVLIKNSTKNREQKYKLVESVSNKHGFINQEEYFEDRIVASKDTSNYYVIQKGYFAYNPSRINVGSLAYKRDENTSIISPLYISFKADTRLDDEFLLSYFFSEQFIKQMNRSFEGSVRNTLSYDNLVKMDILLPCKAEQQKISSFLVTLNNKIDLETALLQQLKLQKQYLLQQLFI